MVEYKVVLESQLGPREGSLRLAEQEGKLQGVLTLLGFENAVSGECTGEGAFHLCHHLRTLVSDLVCDSEFALEENRISGTLHYGRNVMRWHGEKISEEKAGDDGNE